MENNTSNTLIVIMVLVALLVGLAVGLMYGKIKGAEEGRAALLAEQEADAIAAQEKLVEQANPFADGGEVNPFEGSYENPFESATINPFAQ
jgi:hypothetical protein